MRISMKLSCLLSSIVTDEEISDRKIIDRLRNLGVTCAESVIKRTLTWLVKKGELRMTKQEKYSIRHSEYDRERATIKYYVTCMKGHQADLNEFI